MSNQDYQYRSSEEEYGSREPSTHRTDKGKLFVGGLNWTTTDETLRSYFEQFGTVTAACIMRDPGSTRSRGFGFVNFQEPSVVEDILNQSHYLDGKTIDPKRAVPKAEQEKTEKLFVAGIPPETEDRHLVSLFAQYGHVLDATIMADRTTHKPRGFGFVTFQDSTGIERALEAAKNIKLNGKLLEVKRAMPKGGRVRPISYTVLTNVMATTGVGAIAHNASATMPALSATSSRLSTASSSSSGSSSTNERSTTKVATIVSDEAMDTARAAATVPRPRKQSKQYMHNQHVHQQQKMNESATYGHQAALLVPSSYASLHTQSHHPLIPHPIMIPGAGSAQYLSIFPTFPYIQQQTSTTSEASGSGSTRATTSPSTEPSSTTEEVVVTTNVTPTTLAGVAAAVTAFEMAAIAATQAMMGHYPAEWHQNQSTSAPWMPMAMPYAAGNYMTTIDSNATNVAMQAMPLQASLATTMIHHSNLVTAPTAAITTTFQQTPATVSAVGSSAENHTGNFGISSNAGNAAFPTPLYHDSTTQPQSSHFPNAYDIYQNPTQHEMYYGAHPAALAHQANMMSMYTPITGHYQYVPQTHQAHHGMAHQMMTVPEWQSAQASYHSQYQQQQYQQPNLISSETPHSTKDRDAFALARES